MKFPLSMLRDFVESPMSAEEIGNLLTMAGFELEGIEEVEGDPVLDIKTMANRGDGLSVFGLAREVLAKDAQAKPTELYGQIYDLRLTIDDFPTNPKSKIQNPKSEVSSTFACPDGVGDLRPSTLVSIETPDCSRYACRIFENAPNGPSPDWLQKRLRQSGMRPVSLLVDLTNYVNLELGQPMHAFDFESLRGGRIVVRKARPSEKLTTLDGVEHELNPDQMMICDAERPVAAAGIMGGAETECSSNTKGMLLESAHFEPASVRRTRKQMGLSTEASYRFERWVDPEGVVGAIERYAMLLQQLDGGGTKISELVDVYPNPPKPKQISVRMSRSDRLLGMSVEAEAAKTYLEKLGFEVTGSGEPFEVKTPTWRPDVVREVDVIEEIGRVHGYDKIPEELPTGRTSQGGVFGISGFVDDVRRAMVNLGFVQTISHSIRDKSPLDFKEDWRVVLKNPISPESAYLRDSMLPSLADAARRNGAKDLHVFEIGKVFVKGALQIDESHELGIMSIGALEPVHWSGPKPPDADFFSLKGAVQEMAKSAGVGVTFDLPRDADRRFHPTRQVGVLGDEGKLWVGTVGQIHPDVAEQADIPANTVMAELDLMVLFDLSKEDTHYKPISRNPAVRRDMSFHFPKSIPYATFERAIRGAVGDLLEDLWAFDLYEGPTIPEGHRNVAIALQLRAFGENLTDEEANRVRDRAAEALARLGATLR